jgi:hypothetical protein
MHRPASGFHHWQGRLSRPGAHWRLGVKQARPLKRTLSQRLYKAKAALKQGGKPSVLVLPDKISSFLANFQHENAEI